MSGQSVADRPPGADILVGPPTMSPSVRRIRVFIADDHPLTLDGIKATLRTDDAFQIVGEAADGPTALRRIIKLRPDVAVLDLTMPGLDGFELAGELLAASPRCRILMLGEPDSGDALQRLLDQGVSGCVLKSSSSDELNRCIHIIAAGGVYLDPAIEQPTSPPQNRARAERNDPSELSPREHEVLMLAAMGHSNKIIAARLRIGAKSVETYKARAMVKLGFSSRVELLRFAMTEGWLGKAGE